MRSELNIVYDTTTGRDLSERSELSRLNVEQLQCFMNGASACGFLLGCSPSTALHVLPLVAFCHKAKQFQLWLAIRFLTAFFDRTKKAVIAIKKNNEQSSCNMIYENIVSDKSSLMSNLYNFY